MADKYTIGFTNKDVNKQFSISPYTVNGLTHPTDSVLHDKAVSAATSLVFYGKGTPNYGEDTHQNFIYLLENFAGELPPLKPIVGQLWFDRTDENIKVFVSNRYPVIDAGVTGDPTKYFVDIEGDHTTTFVNGYEFEIFGSGTATDNKRYKASGNSTFNGTDTRVEFSGTLVELTGLTVGGWVDVLQTNSSISMIADLDMGGFSITNLADPTDPLHATTKQYVDGTFVDVAGDTMTGFLELHADPTDPLHATTKQYVDNLFNLDTAVNGDILQHDGTAWVAVDASTVFIPFTGASGITGRLIYDGTTSGNIVVGPSVDQNDENTIVNKQWVIDYVTAFGGAGVTDNYLTNAYYDSGTDTLVFEMNTTADVQILNFASQIGSSLGDTTTITHQTFQLPFDEGDIFAANAATQFPSYPQMPLSTAVDLLAQYAATANAPNYRAIVTSTGAASYNLFTEGNVTYTGGYHTLQVYVNGMKYIASERAYVKITDVADPLWWPTTLTNLSIGSPPATYDLDITVDGTPYTLTVNSLNAQTFGELATELNAQLDSSPPINATVVCERGYISIYANEGGTGHSITVNPASSLLVALDSGSPGGVLIDQFVPSTDYGYKEVAQYGNSAGEVIEFHAGSVPPVGAVIEVISEPRKGIN